MIYPKYEAKVVFYKRRKPISYHYITGSLSYILYQVRLLRHQLRAGWYLIENLVLLETLLDYETKGGK